MEAIGVNPTEWANLRIAQGIAPPEWEKGRPDVKVDN